MKYVITDNQLILECFWFKPKTQDLPAIKGMKPVIITKKIEPIYADFFSHAYYNLNEKVPFTGSFQISRYLKESKYIEMGYLTFNVHKTVLKLDFEDGTLVDAEDITQQVKKGGKNDDNKEIKPKSMDPQDLDEWVRKCFSLERHNKLKKSEE